METLVFAYLAAWALTAAYLGWLTLKNVHLESRQRKLLLQERNQQSNAHAKAA
jgi:hypothetical protein